MTKKMFLIAGEPSGDGLGGSLIEAIKKRSAEPVEFLGIGGDKMQKAGFRSLLPMDELCVMGIWEIIWHLPRLIKILNAVVEEIEKAQPDIVVTIDLPDFNFQLAKKLKERGISKAKIVHYVAPTVWAWRPGRAEKISKFLDGLICLFPFEPPLFEKHGLPAQFVGHPLIEKDFSEIDPQEFRTKNRFLEDTLTLGVFFGSRESELKALSETLKETVEIFKEQFPDMVIIIPTLPHLEYNVMKLVQSWEWPAFVISRQDIKWDAFAACDVALAVSGTVGLELAYLGVPHAIAYKMHPVSWLAVKYMVKIRYAHLANILLDKDVVPEFLQGNCSSLKIASGLMKLLKDDKTRDLQINEFKKIPELLGAGQERNPSEKAADFIFSIMNK